MVLCCLQGEVVGEVFDFEVLVLDFHRRAFVDLNGEDAFECSAVLVQVDQVGGGVSVDPVLMMVASDQDSEVVPLVGGEFFEGKVANDPGLSIGVYDDFLPGVGKDASTPFLVEHAIVLGRVGDDVTLVTGYDVQAEVRAGLAAVL